MKIVGKVNIPTDGLYFHIDPLSYRCYGGSGTNVSDLTINGNDGTLTNGATVTDNLFSFDGTNDKIDCGTMSDIGSSLTEFTVSAWVYPTRAQGSLIVENGSGYTTNTFYLAQENGTDFTFSIYGSDGANGYDVIYSDTTYSINTWYHLTGTWKTTEVVDIYLNGVLNNGTRSGNGARTTVIDGNNNMTIGARPPSAAVPFQGDMGGIMIYTRKLTASEILNIYNAQRHRYGL